MTDEGKGSLFRRFLKTKIGRVLTNSWFVSVILGIITFYLIGFSPDPYTFEIQKARKIADTQERTFTYKTFILQLIQKCVIILERNAILILYGSYARGDIRDDSD